VLLIETASKFSHLYIRDGRILSALSVSIKFVVNETGSELQPVQECINQGKCVVAADLNATIPFSIAINIGAENTLTGLVQTMGIDQLEVTASLKLGDRGSNFSEHKSTEKNIEYYDLVCPPSN
jgi:hypothetical protein